VKTELGQFSIFGAIEENASRVFSDYQRPRDLAAVAWRTQKSGAFQPEECGHPNLVEWAAGLSTGRAQEMQKGSVSGGSDAEKDFWSCRRFSVFAECIRGWTEHRKDDCFVVRQFV
jgi:hypothetical protein